MRFTVFAAVSAAMAATCSSTAYVQPIEFEPYDFSQLGYAKEEDYNVLAQFKNPLKTVADDLSGEAKEGANEVLDNISSKASDEMKKVLHQIPYLREVLVGGELAKMAFDYMVDNAPQNVKADMKGAFRTAAVGRYKAFKHWLTKAWSGKSDLQTIIGDYEDYLSLFEPTSKEERLSLHEYFDATRAPGDDGHFNEYTKIMNMMG